MKLVRSFTIRQLLASTLVVAACTAQQPSAPAVPAPAETHPPYVGPHEAGRLTAPPRNEASGLAASRRDNDLLWTHDDSGGAPVLYAVTTHGALRGRLRVGGVKNQDWEDVAAFTLDGKPWLLVADTGDNDHKRRRVDLHIVPEPAADTLSPEREEIAAPWVTLRMNYEDGPKDCEAVAFDAKERAIYLLTKRDEVPRLYRVALPAPLKSGEPTAQFVGLVPHLPKPSRLQRLLKGHLGQQRARPCAMDFAPDGSAAVVLTYGDVVLFPRSRDESWADAMAREPIVLAPHYLLQAEAVCFANDGTAIFVASETSRTLLRYDRP